MRRIQEIQAVIFDLYGTLIYLANETRPYKKLFAHLDLQTAEEFRRARKIALTENFENLAGLVERINPDSQMKVERYEQEIMDEIVSAELYPKTISTLESLMYKNLKLGLISNLASPYKQPFFKLGLDKYFDKILFSCETGLAKPDIRIYQKMIANMGISPSKMLMAGDKINNDVEAAKLAGMRAVHIDRKDRFPGSIFSLDEILGWI